SSCSWAIPTLPFCPCMVVYYALLINALLQLGLWIASSPLRKEWKLALSQQESELVTEQEIVQENVIRTENLSKAYGDFYALKDVDLSVPRHSITGFLGPNGAGKSTAIK